LQLPGADHPAILAGNAHRQRAGPGDQAGDIFIDGAGQHHLHHFHHRRVRDTQTVDERGLDGEALQHRVDLRAAAMHHHRIDADLLQQRDVVAELLGEVFLTHRMTTVFHHHGRAGIAAQERQGLCEDMGLFSRRGDVDCRRVCFAHTARLGRGGLQGQAASRPNSEPKPKSRIRKIARVNASVRLHG
jgi:hypothetical protein